MKKNSVSFLRFLCLSAGAGLALSHGLGQTIIVKPARGGALDTNAPMIHVDVFYDYAANQMRATLDTSQPVPRLLPLPAGYGFDTLSNYAVLNGKAYNFQYAWNPGGTFSPPAGAAVWIECLSRSPELECYDGPGNKMISPPRTYAPIFGTGGSSVKWQWYGAMAHNSYAVLNPTHRSVSADYRVYFGDALTGARDAYTQYTDATVRLTWNIDLPGPPELQFGALDLTNGASLCWLDADDLATNSRAVVNFNYTNVGSCALQYECSIPLTAVAATEANGGPVTNHAAPGSCLELQFVSLAGPAGSVLSGWQPGEAQPLFALPAGETGGTNRIALSANDGTPNADPYGQTQPLFSLSKPGLYCLAFKLVDSSTNGPAGGPLHSASPVYHIYLQAGLTLSGLGRQGTSAAALFGGEAGQCFYLESCATPDPAAGWQTVAGPLTGTGRLQTLVDPAASSARLFYRLRATTP